jgi:hypothetical protein
VSSVGNEGSEGCYRLDGNRAETRLSAISRHRPSVSLASTGDLDGTPDRTRTCGLLVRNQTLYPLSYGRACRCRVWHRWRGLSTRLFGLGSVQKPAGRKAGFFSMKDTGIPLVPFISIVHNLWEAGENQPPRRRPFARSSLAAVIATIAANRTKAPMTCFISVFIVESFPRCGMS